MPTLSPQFRLFSADLTFPKDVTGRPSIDIEKFFSEFKEFLFKQTSDRDDRRNSKPTEWGPFPIGLRWSMIPEFGFPREAFKVYRRRQQYNFSTWLNSPENITGFRQFNFDGQDQYLIVLFVTPAAGTTVVCEALAHNRKIIPELTQTINTGQTVVLKSPFIRYIHIHGSGVLSSLVAVNTQSVVNQADWELIQYVGLPFPNGRTTAYSSQPQGFVFATTSPDIAALQRLMIGKVLHHLPPGISPAIASPEWRAPEPVPYLDDIVQNPNGTLSLIQECLENCDDSSWVPQKRQPAYIALRKIAGIHQVGIAHQDNAEVRVPVVASSMVGVSTDNYYSLGIGFGTYDFIKRKENIILSHRGRETAAEETFINSFDSGYDYMVTSEFILRPSEDFQFLDFFHAFDERHTFAALSETLPTPVPVQALRANRISVNRPTEVDGLATESLRLSWDPPIFPQSYGLATLVNQINPYWLNDEIQFLGKTYRPYSTREPRNELPDENTGRHAYIESESPLPLTGVSHDLHVVAGIDVMGRWSAFSSVNHNAVAIEPQKPALISCKLSPVPLDVNDPEKPYPPTPATIPSILEIEFAWEWTDRKLSKIEFAGRFYDPSNNPPANPPGHFFINATNSPAHAIITVSFNNAGVPSSDFGTVIQLHSTDTTNPNLKKYRLVVTGITSTMPVGEPHGVGYAVHARALEKVYVPTNNFSIWIGPVKNKLDDPRKPEVVTLPATVQFTALPDATRKGRGRLTWPIASGAIGYHAYEASEIAIREYIKPIAASDTPIVNLLPLTATLVERATQLRDLLLVNKYGQAAAKAFSKYNKKMLSANTVELEINSGSEGLTVYRISSMNASQVESDKSSPVFFAVPRVSTPAPPILMLKSLDHDGIEVMALNGAGAEPAGFRVYRVRKSIPSTDIGTKGLPIIMETHPQWQASAYTNRAGTSLPGKKILDSITVRSWKPYYYQVTALGIRNDNNGILSGESTGSATQVAYFPPITNPVLTLLSTAAIVGNPTAHLITNLPFDKIDLGRAMIEVYQMKDIDGKSTKVNIGTFFSDDLSVSDAARPALSIVSSDPVTQSTTIQIIFPADFIKGAVKVTDPLRKQSEIAINF